MIETGAGVTTKTNRWRWLLVVALIGYRIDVSAVERAPDLDIPVQTLHGEEARLTDYAGQVIVLNFWASWCFPCRYEMPHLQKIHNRFEDQGLVVIAVAVDDELPPARAFQAEHGFTFPMLFDADGTAKKAMGVGGVPETYIIDRLGNLIPVRDPATGVSSIVINNPMVWESDSIIELLTELVAN